MRKLKVLITLFTLLPLMAAAQATVIVETAGSLEEQIRSHELLSAIELTIKGELNGTDIRFLRSLLTDGLGASESKLRSLDLSDVRIVEGGEAYGHFSEKSNDNTDVSACYTHNDELGDYMFYDCASLRSIVLPHSIKSIGVRCFTGDLALASIDIPEGVRRIGFMAFAVCDHLENVVLPSTLLSIDAWAFMDCNSLKQISISATVPPAYGFLSFDYPADCKLLLSEKLSQEVVEYYKEADGWKNFGEITQKSTSSINDASLQSDAYSTNMMDFLLTGQKAMASSKGIHIRNNKIFLKR